ncbi:MAG: response regulator [Thermoanaerobaculia bacterium]
MTLQSPSILIVEDSSTVRQMLTLNLKQLSGCRITEAANGAEALAKLSAQPFDLILTDINMPVMDGLKLVGFVRQNESLKHIPIIIITTKGADEDRERGLALGANAYIAKPIQASTLMQTVRKLLAENAAGPA